jgi:pyruvate dehydrogenase E2 component (dihydrolipoamide acetyltransferase)
MEIPSSHAGVVKELKLKVGDKVSEGAVILTLATGDAAAAGAQAPAAAGGVPAQAAAAAAAPAAGASAIDEAAFALAYAGPAVRKLARERGVDLGKVKGSGDHGRILREDVEAFAKGGGAPAPAAKAAAAPAGGGIDLLPWPKVDFAKFGPVERKELSRIKKISAANLHRNWVVIPHVTTHDEADITDLEQFRVQMNKELEKSGVKVSMLPFMMKAAVATLKKFPEFNASLDGDALVLKHYWHIGFAADTPNGLVVPVIRDVDKKSIPEIAKEMGDLAKLARDGKLKPDQMSGGTFTISSLGGIGGIYFTPIINAPEVSIMGVCKSYWKQHSSDGKTSSWRLTLPLSLSWDHRVIDGAAAARFNVHFANLLADMRRIMF